MSWCKKALQIKKTRRKSKLHRSIPAARRAAAGFTLIEMVISILLIGIMSMGLYNIIISGVQNYNTAQEFLDTSNSVSRAMTVIRKDMANAVMPQTGGYSPSGSGPVCLYDSVVDAPGNGSGGTNNPVVIFSNGQSPSICQTSNNCNEAAFFESDNQLTPPYGLIIYCVSNNILYKEEVEQNGTTNLYPIAYNISSITF